MTTTNADPRPAPPPTLVARLVAPVVVFLLGKALFSAVAASTGARVLDGGTWAKWDSYLYLFISRTGYSLVPCDAGTGYAPDQWCGTAGWFPLLPTLIAGARSIGIPDVLAGITIAAVFHLATLLVVWNLFLGARVGARELLVLVFAAIFPGAIYFHALFPISLLACFALLAIHFAITARPLLAGLAGLLAAMCHSTGFVLGAALLVWGVGFDRSERVWRRVVPGLLTFGGYAISQAIFRHATGRWDAYFLVQAKYGHRLTNPFSTLGTVFSHLRSAQPGLAGPAWQSLLVLAIVVTSLVVWWRSRNDRHDLTLPLLTAGAFWLMPLMLGPMVGFYRSEALVLPAILVLRRLPIGILAAFVVLAGVVAAFVGADFFRGQIV